MANKESHQSKTPIPPVKLSTEQRIPLEKHFNTYIPDGERIRGIHYDRFGIAKGWFPEPRWYGWDEFNTDNETPFEILHHYARYDEYEGDYDSDDGEPMGIKFKGNKIKN
jgi:hypothetical protein